jgi:hypothetical protein
VLNCYCGLVVPPIEVDFEHDSFAGIIQIK